MTFRKYVVITRAVEESKRFSEQLELLGLHTLVCPSIMVTKNLSIQELKKYFSNISSYNWIVFTSSNGVIFFMESLKEVGEEFSLMKNIRVATVGKKTAKTAEAYGLSVSVIPTTFTATNLTNELFDIKGETILLPRSNIGSKEILTQLKIQGATVTDMPIYRTTYRKTPMRTFNKLLAINQILCLTFTSPSTVTGFMQNISVKRKSISLPVVSIGPTTTKAIRKYGFTHVYTADTQTTEGMLIKLKECVL